MNIINRYRVTIAVVLFATFGYTNAQDTIHCPDAKYYWNNELCYEGEGSYFSYFHFRGVSPDRYPPNRVLTLKQNVFPNDSTYMVYGIAGATIGCYNPYGCYFYLYKKIGTTFELLDSVEWTHKNQEKPKYIEYNTTDGFTLGWESYNGVDYLGNPVHIPIPDSGSNIVNIYEAYFKNPIYVRDTIYIGMNPNGLSYYKYAEHPLGNSNWDIEEPNGCTLLYTSHFRGGGFTDTTVAYSSCWYLYLSRGFELETNEEPRCDTYHRGKALFPIMEPHPCAPISTTFVDSLTHNTAYIRWEQTYLSSYYQIEYGPRGFQHGSGVFIDSVTITGYILQGLNADMEYTAYVRSYCSSSDTVSSWKCIEFRTLSDECPQVENLDTVYVSDTNVRIEWKITDSEISFCQIEWGEAGFEHGSGTVINNIHDTIYTFRNLTPNTTYDIYLRTYCERSQVFGQWQKLTFTTYGDSTTAISTIDSDIPVELHPNPTTGLVTLSRNDIKNVEVMDATGKVVMIVENKNVIDLSKLTKGYYTLRITTSEGVAIRKVIRK